MNIIDPIIIEPENQPEFSIIWLHGLGADGNDFVPIIPELELQEYSIRFIFPNAPIRPVTINNGIPMPAWYDIRGIDIADKEDFEGMETSKNYLTILINKEIDQGIPAENIIIAGFSQGGAVALYSMMRLPHKLAGCMALSTYLPFMKNSKDQMQTDSIQTPIFWGHGDQDTVVPQELGTISKEHLTSLGYTVEYQTYTMAHSVCAEEIDDIRNWIKKCLKKNDI